MKYPKTGKISNAPLRKIENSTFYFDNRIWSYEYCN